MNLSFNNGVFVAQISEASLWNIDSKINDVCAELRVYPPANMLESRKITDVGTLQGDLNTKEGEGGRQFRLDKRIGIRQKAQNWAAIHGTENIMFVEEWPTRYNSWPKRNLNDDLVIYTFEFFEPPTEGRAGQLALTAVGPQTPSTLGDLYTDFMKLPALGSVKYSNPKRGIDWVCVVVGGGESDCKLRRISKENKGADGDTIGGTA